MYVIVKKITTQKYLYTTIKIEKIIFYIKILFYDNFKLCLKNVFKNVTSF